MGCGRRRISKFIRKKEFKESHFELLQLIELLELLLRDALES
jgi:hypothetical protein